MNSSTVSGFPTTHTIILRLCDGPYWHRECRRVSGSAISPAVNCATVSGCDRPCHEFWESLTATPTMNSPTVSGSATRRGAPPCGICGASQALRTPLMKIVDSLRLCRRGKACGTSQALSPTPIKLFDCLKLFAPPLGNV